MHGLMDTINSGGGVDTDSDSDTDPDPENRRTIIEAT